MSQRISVHPRCRASSANAVINWLASLFPAEFGINEKIVKEAGGATGQRSRQGSEVSEADDPAPRGPGEQRFQIMRRVVGPVPDAIGNHIVHRHFVEGCIAS